MVAERGFDIGQKVRELRRAQALTQEELSDMSGVHGTTISDLERGAGRASARTTRRLAKALGVEVRELTSGGTGPQLPGGAKTEEHLDAVLDHEAELRERQEAREREGSGPGGGAT